MQHASTHWRIVNPELARRRRGFSAASEDFRKIALKNA
jgi:hypothetical protein